MRPELTARSRRVLLLAEDEAKRLGHGYVGTEHLLLGLMREGEGVAVGIIESMGVSLEKVRNAVNFIVGSGAQNPLRRMPLETQDAERFVAAQSAPETLKIDPYRESTLKILAEIRDAILKKPDATD